MAKDSYPRGYDLYGPLARTIHIGYIRDVVAISKTYLVEISQTIVTCIDVRSQCGNTPLAPREIGMYPPSTQVIVLKPVGSSVGYILGAPQSLVGAKSMNIFDHVAAFTGSDAYQDVCHTYPLLRKNASGLKHYGSGRPVDAVAGSDQGLVNELGVGYGISRLFSWMRACEAAGITFFYQDQLTRLCAWNYDFWHAGGERWIRDDEGEISDVDLFTCYPWESLGLINPGDAFKKAEGGGWYKPGQYKTWYVPQAEGQTMIPRLLKMRGYLGDLVREMVMAPELAAVASPETYSSKSIYTGLSEFIRSSDGAVSIRSAKSIVFEKYTMIPVPKRLQPAEQDDEEGDSLKNYAPSGIFGEGDKEIHQKKDFEFANRFGLDWFSQLWDYHAYTFNYYNVQPIIAHEKDWWLPEEGAPPGGSDTDPAAFIPTEPMENTFLYPVPPFATLQVDHRVGGIRYYQSRSGISLLPDGSVSIEDGYGSSILLSGGSIFLSCPGDVWLQPGRNINAWAPQDLILRAQRSVDVTASKRDVRIKAERNLHMLAGNEGDERGGILLECRSTGRGDDFNFENMGEDAIHTGIALKSEFAPTLLYGNPLYLRALQSGALVLDAAGGDGDLICIANHVIRWAQEDFTDIAGAVPAADMEELPEAAAFNYFSPENFIMGSRGNFYSEATQVLFAGDGVRAVIRGDLVTEGQGVFDGQLLCTGSIKTNGGLDAQGSILCSGVGTPSGGLLGKADLSDELDIQEQQDQLQESVEEFDEAQEAAAATLLAFTQAVATIYSEEDFIALLGFSCRTMEQYNLVEAEFGITEMRWQQQYRQADIGNKWDESVVFGPPDAAGTPTLPYPGQEIWDGGSGLLINDMVLWDWTLGKSLPRDPEIYGEAKGSDMEYKALKDNYLVSVTVPE